MTRPPIDALLPAALRARDAEVGGPLAALLSLVDEQLLHLREDLAQLHDDQFIETCAEWVIPYIGDLIGHEPRHGTIPRIASPRAEVARTVGYRRRKGTVAVLQQLAQDVTGWPTRVVEAFKNLATAQHLDFLRPEHHHSPDLRRARPLAAISTAFAAVPVRPSVRADDHTNLPDVVAYVWRLRSSPLQRVTPHTVAPGRHTFSPLGDPVPLFSRPPDSDDAGERSDPAHVPAPISRRDLFDRLPTYYGLERSLWVRVGPDLVPLDRIDAADLSDRPDDSITDPPTPPQWAHEPRPGRVLVDPVLGRLAVSPLLVGPVEVGFHVGVVTELGGGQYERDSLGPEAPPADLVVRGGGDLMALVLAALAARPGVPRVLEIADSATYTLTPPAAPIPLPANLDLTIRAADRERPLVVLTRDLAVDHGDAAALTLDGLVIAGGALVVGPGPRALTLRHCTLVPGRTRTAAGRPAEPAAPSLVVRAPDLELTVTRSVTGPLRISDAARAHIDRSVVDAGTAAAYAGPDDGPGAPLDVDAATILGSIHALSIGLVTNAILHGRVTCERRQTGCLRFSFVPADSPTPRRFRCQPAGDGTDRDLAPQFTSLRYGAPAYAQLSRRCALAIRAGADDESELGVHHDLFEPHREGNLRARLAEYLRVGLRAGVVFVT